MTSQNNENLKCNSARFKHAEALYFLDTMRIPAIWNGHSDVFDFYLNTLVSSSAMVVDYVHSDFIFHTVKPSIYWLDWEKNRKNRDSMKNFIDSHPMNIAINKFLRFFKDERERLHRKPLVNYFMLKRNKITHIRWDATKFASYSETLSGEQTYRERFIENTIALEMYRTKQIPIPSDYFDERISDKDKEITLARLSSEPMLDICKEYLDELFAYIQIFEEKNFFR